MQLHKLARVVASAQGKSVLTVDGRALFELNPVAAAIWGRLLEGQSTHQIITHFVTQFGVPEERVMRDLAGFLDLLRRHYLILDSPRNNLATVVRAPAVGNGEMKTVPNATKLEDPVNQGSLCLSKPEESVTHSPEHHTAIKPEVRTFDLFDTLIARRCIHPRKIFEQMEKRLDQPGFAARRVQAERELAGTQYTLTDVYRRLGALHEMEIELQLERENIFPVTEMVSKVKPNDLIVSDMYLPRDFLRSAVNEVTNLILNPIVVTTNGKSTGTVWETLKDTVHIVEHTGDCPHSDGRMARNHGIPVTLTKAAALSVEEQALYDDGFVGLAQTIREARLTTFENDTFARRLQLLQIQLNFPILFLAAVMLDRKLTTAKISNALMSSRDCFLWHYLQQRVRTISHATYKVVYFLTSRLTRRFPSPTYLQYFNNYLNESSCVVDVSGTGTSLKRLIEQSANPKTPRFMIARYFDDTQGGL